MLGIQDLRCLAFMSGGVRVLRRASGSDSISGICVGRLALGNENIRELRDRSRPAVTFRIDDPRGGKKLDSGEFLENIAAESFSFSSIFVSIVIQTLPVGKLGVRYGGDWPAPFRTRGPSCTDLGSISGLYCFRRSGCTKGEEALPA